MKNIHRKYFEMWGDEQSQNFFLKGLLVVMLITSLFLTISLAIISSKKPFVISIDKASSKIIKLSKSKTKEQNLVEIKRSVEKFIKYRHNWTSEKIKERLEKSSKFIAPSFRKRFLASNRKQLKEASKKKIAQRFYISKAMNIDIDKNKVEVTGDRILIVDGLRATQPMTFRLSYIFKKRTLDNPEGVYITSENLISSLEH